MHRVVAGFVFALLLFVGLAPVGRAHGLLTATPAGAPVTLTSHRVEARVDGPVASVTVEQVFANRSDARLEGTYLFPLPEGAAVSGFAMTLGGKLVKGEVLEASRARAIYESIVRQRRDPGLLEYVGRGLFRARVFPIEPRGEVRIRLTFQQVLPEDQHTLEFRYPLATDRLHGEPVDETVISVDLRSELDIKAVYSPSHDVAVVRRSDRKVHVSYEQTGGRQTRDFLLHVGRSAERVGLTLLSHKEAGEDGTFLAVLAPPVERSDLPVVPKDVAFVLDVSGSMSQHQKLDQAKRALAFGVSVLRPQDRFNVVTFSTEVDAFRDALVPASGATKAAALAWIEGRRAGGGTHIEWGLKTGLGMGTQDRLFMVVFVTDGRPTVGERNPERLVRAIEWSNIHHARVFTFGVGYDLDVKLLDRLAETTRGARDYVMPKEELEIATSRFFRKVADPVLTDVAIDLGGVVYDVYPSRMPDLFSGGQVVLMGRYGTPGPRTVRLRGRLGAREVEYVFETSLGDAERAPYLPRLWANRKIAFLLDQIRLHGKEQELVDEVLRLGTRYAIVTPYTAVLVTPAAPTMPMAPMTPGTPMAPEHSKQLKAQKERSTRTDGEQVKLVAGRTFQRDAQGRWVDTAWDGKGKTLKVEAFSAAWTQLLERGPKVAKVLGLGERVVFVLDGKVYEIVPR